MTVTWVELEEVRQLAVQQDVVQAVEGLIRRVSARGDGIAVYENVDLGHPEIGLCKFVSFGGENAQLGGDVPPEKLPDIGSTINWRFMLKVAWKP